jgi:hypothetical protein
MTSCWPDGRRAEKKEGVTHSAWPRESERFQSERGRAQQRRSDRCAANIMSELGSGSTDCAMTCGGFGVSCGALVDLLTCEDVTKLDCECGGCCGKFPPQPPASPPLPITPPQPPLVDYGNSSDDCPTGNQLALCANREDLSRGFSWLGTGLAIALGLVALMGLLRWLYMRWLEKLRSQREASLRNVEPDGVVLHAVPVAIATAAPPQGVSSATSPPEAVITGIVSSQAWYEGGVDAQDAMPPDPEQL